MGLPLAMSDKWDKEPALDELNLPEGKLFFIEKNLLERFEAWFWKENKEEGDIW